MTEQDRKLGAGVVGYAYALESDAETWCNDGLPAFISDRKLAAGTLIHRGVVHQSMASSFLPGADDIIEHMGNSAADENSEWCDGFPHVSDEAEAELELALLPLKAWADKNCDVSFYTIGKMDLYTITSADVDAADQYRKTLGQ